MKNNKIKGIMIAVLALTIAVGATLAYLISQTDPVTNKFSFAGIDPDSDIVGEIEENWTEGDGKGIMPGAEITKEVWIKNISGSQLTEENAMMYGAIRVTYEKKQSDGTFVPCTKADMALINTIMSLDIDTANWTAYGDADDNNIIYVYKDEIARQKTSEKLFTKVTIDSDVNKETIEKLKAFATDGEVNITVTGAVIQAVGVDYDTAADELVAELSKP